VLGRLKRIRRQPRVKTAAFCLSLLVAVFALSTTAQLQTGVSINFGDVHQRIDGFGASDRWHPALTDAQADLFFSPTVGIGLSILRVSIDPNGNDTSPYSNATKAAARGAVVWAAPWSAPGAWKDNGTTGNGGHLLPAFYDAWATRLAGFASTLQQNAGVPLYGVSVQNEPDWVATWDTMNYSNQEMANFIKVLGPKLSALNPRPRLITPETGGWGYVGGYTSAILGDSVAAPYLDIVAGHQYGGVAAPSTTGKPIWETEMSSFEAFDPSINNALMVAQWIHDAIVTGNVSAWHYWWLIGQNSDDEGLIGYSGNTQMTKRLYAMGNFSKFVRPGFFAVGVVGAANGVSLTAYKDPATGAFVIVAINQNAADTPLNITLNGLSANAVTPWVTSNSLSLGQQAPVTVSGGSFTATLPALSITSFVGSGSGATPPRAPTALRIQ
jgi:glucuronoarabinoxylan endo-1,4-beta-xylanase